MQSLFRKGEVVRCDHAAHAIGGILTWGSQYLVEDCWKEADGSGTFVRLAGLPGQFAASIFTSLDPTPPPIWEYEEAMRDIEAYEAINGDT